MGDEGRSGVTSYLRQLYEDGRAGSYERLREAAVAAFSLSVPGLGIEVAGVEAVISWLEAESRSAATGPMPALSKVVDLGAFVVASFEGDGEMSCDVYSVSHEPSFADGARLRSCVRISVPTGANSGEGPQ